MLQALRTFFSKPAVDPATAALYHACIAQARQTAFYEKLGVPDSVDGRFDMLLLHVLLVMRRMDDMDAKQRLFDLMFADMDRSLREMGVGDMSIRKKMKPMIQAFYGRAQAYEAAFGADDETLATTLGRNLYGATPVEVEKTRQIATYVRQVIAALDRQAPADLHSGKVEFVAPTFI